MNTVQQQRWANIVGVIVLLAALLGFEITDEQKGALITVFSLIGLVINQYFGERLKNEPAVVEESPLVNRQQGSAKIAALVFAMLASILAVGITTSVGCANTAIVQVQPRNMSEGLALAYSAISHIAGDVAILKQGGLITNEDANEILDELQSMYDDLGRIRALPVSEGELQLASLEAILRQLQIEILRRKGALE